jgi:cytochrome oxidase assembly protein ShyY1
MIHCKTEARPEGQLALTQHGFSIIPALLAVLTLSACVAAVWQWQRSELHTTMAQNAKKQRLIPLLLNIETVKLNSASFVRVQGRWLDHSTTYISPRLMDGKMGAIVISVLQYSDLSGKKKFIAVNRGWAQQSQPTQAPTLAALTSETVTLEGGLVDAMPKAYELQSIKPTALGLWQNHDVLNHGELIGKTLESKVLVLSTTSSDTEAQSLRRIPAEQAIDTLEQKAASNRGYTFQWLGLALVGLVGLGWMWRSRSSLKKKP